MARPRLLDLFCGAGGAAMGYHRAGFDVVGVDIVNQPNFPFEFHQADALEFPLDGFDVVHASPPCQRYSTMTRRWSNGAGHPDLVGQTRQLLEGSDLPWVVENVPGSPLRDAGVLCGSMFYLHVRRHRLFESNAPLLYPMCNHESQGRVVGVYGNPGGSSKRDGITFGGVEDWREAMQIDWMTARELREAIPPAYTSFIGEQILAWV